MYDIRRLTLETDLKDFRDIVIDAYPGFNIESQEQKDRLLNNFIKTTNESKIASFYGAFKDQKLVGGMKYYDFTMNLLGEWIDVGGVGLVAVSQLHKKEKVAFEIINHFLEHYRKKDCPMVLLYPFNIAFYKKMGFGLGPSIYQYKFKPSDLPKGKSKANIRFLSLGEEIKLNDLYQDYFKQNNGLILKTVDDFKLILSNPKNKVIGYFDNEVLKGYVIYSYKTDKDNFLLNNLVINEMVYLNNDALSELLTFLNSQSDQFNYIIYNVHDEGFRFILENPVNYTNNLIPSVHHETSVMGTGLMYRVVNVIKLFEKLKNHNFNNENLKLKLNITDSLINDNNKSVILEFNNGKVQINEKEEYEAVVNMDINDFSSLITCTVDFITLYRYGKVSINDTGYLDKVNRIFSSDKKPICLTSF